MVVKKKVLHKRTIYDYFIFGVHELKLIHSYILFSTILFFLTTLFGFFFPYFFEDYILKFIAEILEKTDGLGWLAIIQFIMANNIQSAFIGMISGVIVGIFPINIEFAPCH